MIPTLKLYTPLRFEEYDAAKQAHFQAIPNYQNLSPAEKYQFLVDRFALDLPQYRRSLYRFYNAHLSNNPAKVDQLTLNQCLDYFEDFHFLYTTTHPAYQVHDNSKVDLLALIAEAIGGCEAGMQARFETILNKYKRNANWLANQLHQQRFQIIELLQMNYNQTNRIRQGMEVHTLKVMLELAEQKHLGIHVNHHVNDEYLDQDMVNEITTYFEQHYPDAFIKYEQDLSLKLTEYLVSETQDFFRQHHIDISKWDSQPIDLTDKQILAFVRFLESYLQLPEEVGGLHTLMAWNEEIEEEEKHEEQQPAKQVQEIQENRGFFSRIKRMAANFQAYIIGNENKQEVLFLKEGEGKKAGQIKNKQSFSIRLRKLIELKLLQEQYCIPLLDIAHHDKNTLKFKEEISNEDFIAICQMASAYEKNDLHQLSVELKARYQVFLNSCGILLEAMEASPCAIWSTFPSELKTNLFFLQYMMQNLEKYLLEAIEEENEEQINQLMDCLGEIVQLNPGYLNGLSPLLGENLLFAQKLVSKNGLLLNKLPISVQNNLAVVQTAIRQNRAAFLYAPHSLQRQLAANNPELNQYVEFYFANYQMLYDSLPNSLKNHSLKNSAQEEDVSQSFFAQEQMKAVLKLARSPRVNIKKLVHYSQLISPYLMMEIIKFRQENNLEALAYCDPELLAPFNQELSPFCSLRQDHWYWNETDFLDFKNTTFKATDFYKKRGLEPLPVLQNLEQTNHWFMAFIHYQDNLSHSPFKNWYQVWLQLKFSVQKSFSLLYSLILFSSIAILTGAIIACVTEILLMNAWYIFFMILSCWLFQMFKEEGSLADYFFGAIFGVILAVCLSVLYSVIEFTFHTAPIMLFDEFLTWPYLIKDIFFPWFSRTYHTVFGTTAEVEAPEDRPEIICENSIMRLLLQSSTSAQQKGELLDKIWHEITIHRKDPEAPSLKNLLDQPYPIWYQGQQCLLSFSQVAAIRRQNSSHFSVLPNAEENSISWGFFKQTSTSKRLQGIPEEEAKDEYMEQKDLSEADVANFS